MNLVIYIISLKKDMDNMIFVWNKINIKWNYIVIFREGKKLKNRGKYI